MDLLWIIIRREYLNIVKKKSFLISTFLVPFGFALIFGIQIAAALFVEKEDYTVLVQAGETEPITRHLKATEMLSFEVVDAPSDSLRMRIQENEGEIFLSLSPVIMDKTNGTAIIYSPKNLSQQVIKAVRNEVRNATREYKVREAGISEEQLAMLEFDLDVQNEKVVGTDTKANNSMLAMVIGYVMGLLIYMLMAIYGSILMQGIIEEKTNRIVEIIVSSIRPYRLLMGKTLAIASVGITQLILWALLSSIVMLVLGLVSQGLIDPEQMSQPGMDAAEAQSKIEELMIAVQNFDWSVMIYFPFYFLGGFFLYGSLMAAAGSAVDNPQDAQQFAMPITIPMILPLLFLSNIIQNPNGSFATFASIFPFFSPTSMLIRLSLTEVPWYELVLSMVLLVATFLGAIWVAARIYSTGILMYGKKPSFREILRWVSYRKG